jgi:hypothetical protein
MIISKKKLEEIIQQRLAEKEKEDYFFRRINDIEKELHCRIDKLYEIIMRLENRLETDLKVSDTNATNN